MKLDQNEPVRRNVYTAAVVVAMSTFFGGVAATLGAVDTITVSATAIAISGSLAVALGEFAAIAFGIERARDKSYGPETHMLEVAQADHGEKLPDAGMVEPKPLDETEGQEDKGPVRVPTDEELV